MPHLRRYNPTNLCYGAQMASFFVILGPVFSASRVQRVSDLHPKFALRPHHVWNLEVWQTSNLRRLRLGEGKKRKIEEEETTGQKYNSLPYSIGRP